ncbi:WW domain-containing oxidoreductase isoform X1 [Bombyx mori]|uniref:WW domain-containing oxidoreductase n=1 Tax=Bombyx mori TaxID=7091 RepID=A0A8R2GA23_BOMMO|nr:WW domain-containing oxidoreductase isoform X1 [Bombyx mori]
MLRFVDRMATVTTRNLILNDKVRAFSSSKVKSLVENYFDLNFRIHGPTGEEVTKGLDLKDKTCLITGANSGVGLEMTKCLNLCGCTVLMACRNTYAASVVAKNTCLKPDSLRLYELNLASLRSVRKCSDDLLNKEKKIDIVILNAGIFGLPWTETVDKLEITFQVNYLSQYYLLMNIEDILADNARVVIISSESHRYVTLPFNEILTPTEETLSLPKNKYSSIKAYNISKLCGILAMHNLGYRWLNTKKTVISAHPGSFVKTRLCRNWWLYEAIYTGMKPFTKTIAQAASTPLYCATSSDLNGLSAIYYKNCERCQESDLASNLQLSFRINDLTKDIIRDRVTMSELPVSLSDTRQKHDVEHNIEDSLLTNYSN